MKTKRLLAKAVEQHSELNFLYYPQYNKGLQNLLQENVPWPMKGQAVSIHVCIPFVGQLLEDFWKFCKKELDYGVQGLLPDNGISITQLWLRYFMFKNYSEKWSWKKNDWVAINQKPKKGDRDE